MKLLTLIAVLLMPMTVTRRTVVLNGDIERIIIPIDAAAETYICAEYPHRLTWTQKPRACREAAAVRDWLLKDPGPEQCH